jgi:cell division protein FtsQ
MAAGRLSRIRVLRRRAIAIAIVSVVLVAGYLLWLRNSSLFSVDEIQVEGVTANRDQVTASLQHAAADMTTLHVRDDELRDAVSGFPTVASIRADSTLLHKLTITVTERLPIAVTKAGGESVPVSADGYLLKGVAFDAGALPSMDPGSGEGPLLDEQGRAQAAILGAVPEPLRDRVKSASWDEDHGGVVVDLDGAPELRFGDGDQAEAKWKAVAAVLADPDLESRSYLDVQVPGRPVTGG